MQIFHCISLRHTEWWYELHILWNGRFSFSYRYNKKKGKEEKKKIILVIKILRVYFVNNFPIYPTAVLAIVIMLYITSLVFIYLITERLYLLTTFLLFLVPHPLPLVITSPISFSMNFLFKIPHVSEIIQYLFFSVWLISFSIMSSKYIHVVKKVRFPCFSWLNKILLNISQILYSCMSWLL